MLRPNMKAYLLNCRLKSIKQMNLFFLSLKKCMRNLLHKIMFFYYYAEEFSLLNNKYLIREFIPVIINLSNMKSLIKLQVFLNIYNDLLILSNFAFAKRMAFFDNPSNKNLEIALLYKQMHFISS